VDNYPIVDASNPGSFGDCMEMFRILYDNGAITDKHDFGIRAIDIRTGNFADEAGDFIQNKNTARLLGLPSRGTFTINNKARDTMMYHTFNGTSVSVVAMLGNSVTELDGMVSLSWSLHREKIPLRLVGKVSPTSRGKGSRTVAGTMVFTLTDHHPLLDLLPGTLPIAKPGEGVDTKNFTPMLLSDEFPPFDINVIMTNEYGFATMLTIYGVEFQDEGGVISVDNVLSELVLQYTAFTMDPLIQVKPNSDGEYDFAGVYNSEYMNLWRRREMAAQGVSHSELESEYNKYYDGIYSTNRKENGVTPYKRQGTGY